MVTTRRQQQHVGGGEGAGAAATAAQQRRQQANGTPGATLTPEQHRARLDEYRAAWAPPKTLAGRLRAWAHEQVVYGSALIGITMLDVGERVAYVAAVALVLGLVAAGGYRQGARVAAAARGALMAWAASQQQQQQQGVGDALGGGLLDPPPAPSVHFQQRAAEGADPSPNYA